MNTNNKRTIGRAQMILVAVVFLGPLLVALFLYFGDGNWRPIGQTNNGTLVQPVISLPEASLSTRGGQATDSSFLQGKWSIAFLNRGSCEEACRKTLIQIRQIRLAAGSESHRLQRVYLGNQWPDEEWIDAGHSGLIVARPDSDAAFAAELASLDTGIYLIDPLGNLMMRYDQSTESKPIFKDLKKLLKYSRIG